MESQSTYIRGAVATLLAGLLARRGLKKGSLDVSGAAAAFAVGFASMASGYRFGTLLIAFYYSGSKLTTVRANTKLKLDENYKVGGQRSAGQVLACSLIASAIAVYLRVVHGVGDFISIDFSARPMESALLAAYIGHYACCAADSWASELGVLSASDPILITTLRRVPPGTNGGVSLMGSVASLAGGAFIGAIYFVASMFTGTAQVEVIILGATTGLIGSLLDSLLGATLQATWYNKRSHKICAEGSHDGDAVHVCGVDVLSNEQVNALSVLLTTAVSAPVAHLLF